MKNFTYYRPTTVEQAVGLLDSKWGTTELLAGGTDLLDLQKEYVAQPDKVVSLNDANLRHEITGITAERGGDRAVTIKAGETLAAIIEYLKEIVPALAQTAKMVGTPQIQNVATIGGNLCQRNRCWYFRDEHVNCLLKGGSKCFALDGENQYHAIFTQGHKCVIVSPSTLAPSLIALNASAEVQGPSGKRTIEVAKLFQAPSGPGDREHVLAPNEIIVSITIPRTSGIKNANYEVNHKRSYDWPLVQAAVAYVPEGNRATKVRIVLGHVAPTPHIAEAAAKAIEGKEVSESTATAAGKSATEGAKPLANNGYKLKLVEVAVKRAILLASGAKPYWES